MTAVTSSEGSGNCPGAYSFPNFVCSSTYEDLMSILTQQGASLLLYVTPLTDGEAILEKILLVPTDELLSPIVQQNGHDSVSWKCMNPVHIAPLTSPGSGMAFAVEQRQESAPG